MLQWLATEAALRERAPGANIEPVGLDAFVRCRCWEDGLCAPPPVSAEHVRVDEGWLTYDVPWENDREGHDRFDTWIRTACPHADMHLCSEPVANMYGCSLFLQQIESFGAEHFPVWVARFPEANGGELPVTEIRRALEELELFQHLCRTAGTTHTVLLDADTREALVQVIGSNQCVFILSGSEGIDVGVDSGGLFIRRGSTGEELLRGMEIRQTVHAPAGQWNSLVTYEDGSGRTVVCSSGVTTDQEFENGRVVRCRHPERLHVEQLELPADAFDYIVEPLTRLCRAALEASHPIVWT
jgi:hypothetical protein